MDNNEKSRYLYQQFEEALSEKLKARKSQYVLEDLNRKQKPAAELKPISSEYLLRSLQNQDDQNQLFSRDAPNRPFLIGAPVPAKQIRSQIESLDNAIVVPQIIDGRVFFLTHGDSDTHTAIESGSAHNFQNSQPVNLKDVKFSYEQLVQLLGPATCQRLEREFARQNRLSEIELAQLRTARESFSSVHTANSLEPNLLSVRTANSLEPNLLSVHSARSPGPATLIFSKSPGLLTAQEREPNLLTVRTARSRSRSNLSARSPSVHTANSLEPNLLSVRTANSLEPNLLSVHSARSPGPATLIFAKSPGLLTAQEREPNLLTVRTARSRSNSRLSARSPSVHTANSLEPNLLSVRTANSLEPNLLSVHSARSPGPATLIFAKSPGLLTAQEREPNLLSTRTARSSASESSDVNTCVEIADDPTIGVLTALSIRSAGSRSSQDVNTALPVLTLVRSSQDVETARDIESTRSSKDVHTAIEIPNQTFII